MTHVNVGSFFGGIADAFKSAFHGVASVVHHPPGWLAVALPLFTSENQRYWAQKLGGSTGAKIYDVGVRAVAAQALGPQGPQLVEAYNRVMDDASRGHADAKAILARAPQIAKLAVASRRGPQAFRAAVAATGSAVKVSGSVDPMYAQGPMSIEHFRHAAIHAVIAAQHQQSSPVYGYLRSGLHQKVYLFGSEPEARTWFDQRALVDPRFDYIAVFVAEQPHVPVAEDFGDAAGAAQDPMVGHWFLPLALGIPAGALGGYYYRKWQEGHPGQIVPGIAAHPTVGQHWGAHLLGADVSAQAPSSWPQTHALIKSAIRETVARGAPTEVAFVWSLETDGTTNVVPFGSYEQALDYMRDRIHTDHVALAAFSRRSRHWPNPLNWTKQDDPMYAPVIAQHVAKRGPQVAGDVVGTYPWYNIVGGLPWQSIVGGLPWQSIVGTGTWGTIVGDAIADVRAKAQDIATQKQGTAVGVIHGADGQWHAFAFNSLDDADDWFGTSTQDKASFTYAAYYDKDLSGTAFIVNEEVGGIRKATGPRPMIRRGIATAS